MDAPKSTPRKIFEEGGGAPKLPSAGVAPKRDDNAGGAGEERGAPKPTKPMVVGAAGAAPKLVEALPNPDDKGAPNAAAG